MKRWRVGVAVALVGLGALAAGAVVAAPRIARRARLAKLLRTVAEARGDERREAVSELVGFEEREAVLAVLRVFFETDGSKQGEGDVDAAIAAGLAVELHAALRQPDPAVRELLERETRSPSGIRRAQAFFLLDELDEPSAPEPPSEARDGWVEASLEPKDAPATAERLGAALGLAVEVLSPVDARLSRDTFICGTGYVPPPWRIPRAGEGGVARDRPWRALLRFAQSQSARIELAPGRARLVPRPRVRFPHETCGRRIDLLSAQAEGGGSLPALVVEPPAKLVEELQELDGGPPLGQPWPVSRALRAIARASGLVPRALADGRILASGPSATPAALLAAADLALAIELSRKGGEPSFCDLAGREEPEALLALAAAVARGDEDAVAPLRRGVELHAIGGSGVDPRVHEALEALAASRELSGSVRFLACRLLAELESPTHARAPSGTKAEPVLFALDPETGRPAASLRCACFQDDLSRLGAALGLAIEPVALPDGPQIATRHRVGFARERPWRALVRIAQELDSRVVLDGGRARLVTLPEAPAGVFHAHRRLSLTLPREDGSKEEVAIRSIAPLLLFPPDSFPDGVAQARTWPPEKTLRAVELRNRVRLRPEGPGAFVAEDLLDRRARLAWNAALLEAVDDRAPILDDLRRLPPGERISVLVELWRLRGEKAAADVGKALVREVEVLAASRARSDATARAAIEGLARSEKPEDRLLAFYLQDELLDPTFPEPTAIDRRCAFTHALLTLEDDEALATALAALDRPWLEVVREAQQAWKIVRVEQGVLVERNQFAGRTSDYVLVPPADLAIDPELPFGGLGEDRRVRALARLNGCRVVQREDENGNIVREVRRP